MNGDADDIINRPVDVAVWHRFDDIMSQLAQKYADNQAEDKVDWWYEPGAGHRPFYLYKQAIRWIHRWFGLQGYDQVRIDALPEISYGQWCDTHGIVEEALYNTESHLRGATAIDMGITPLGRHDLACLTPEEIGTPEYTIEGWLDAIDCDRP